jgi:hypothetical protein
MQERKLAWDTWGEVDGADARRGWRADDGLAETIVDEVPTGVEEASKEAAENCPVSVISVE